MTYLELINRVLVKLREEEVASPSQSRYTKLIGQFVNETKREVEDAYQWLELRGTVKVTTVASQFRYTLNDVGKRFRMLDVFNDTEDYPMRKVSDIFLNRLMNYTDTQEGRPYYYTYNTTTNGDPDVDMWPIPDQGYDINFNVVVPQEYLANAQDELLVPDDPVFLGAYAKAISERGDDSGRVYGEAMQEYKMALDDAIGIQSNRLPEEETWRVV